MVRMINGEPANWSGEIFAKWVSTIEDFRSKNPEVRGEVTSVNYFSPRPYVDQYDRGSKTEGFMFTIGRDVWQINLK